MKYLQLYESYDKFQPLNSYEKIYDFHKDDNFKHLFYSDNFTEKDLKEFGKILRNNRGEDYVLMYHGTSCNNDIEHEGLKKTTVSTKKSLQSQPGYVYLSIFPGMAKTFAEIAYPYDEVCVYQVFIKLKYLKADSDQLHNKNMWGNGELIKTNLVNSLVYGRGARVNRNILPYEIKKLD